MENSNSEYIVSTGIHIKLGTNVVRQSKEPKNDPPCSWLEVEDHTR